jgi:7-cyano-7-deazaguanine synthase in queuosine biosynthesis
MKTETDSSLRNSVFLIKTGRLITSRNLIFVSISSSTAIKSELSLDKTQKNNDDRSTYSVCRRDYAYILKASMGAKLIHCSFRFGWCHNKDGKPGDNFVEDI